MAAPSPLSKRQFRAMLTATILASSMAFIDGTALNVALPSIQTNLGLTASQLLWIVNGYMIFLSALMLTGGGMGDVYGRKKIFIVGIILFSIASGLCGIATSGTMLIIFRCLQGVGAALLIPGSLALITALVPEANRGKAIGLWSMFSALTTVAGPVLGGWLAGLGLWRIIFFLNIPLAAAAIWLLVKHVPVPAYRTQKHLDIPGAILATTMLGAWSFGFIEAGEKGFENRVVILSLLTGLFSTVAFIARERRSLSPMLPPELFKSLHFSVGNSITALIYGALGSFLFFYPLNLIQIQGYSPGITGLTMIPFALLIALMSWISGKWVDVIGSRFLLIVGQMLLAIGYFLFAIPELTEGPSAYFSNYFIPIVILGLGMGLSVVPITTTVMNAVPGEMSGTASGVNNTVARSAQVLAIAIMGSVALTIFQENAINYIERENEEILSHPGITQVFKELADAQPPGDLSPTSSEVFNKAVEFSFITVFRTSALVASIMCALGTLLAYGFIKRKTPS